MCISTSIALHLIGYAVLKSKTGTTVQSVKGTVTYPFIRGRLL